MLFCTVNKFSKVVAFIMVSMCAARYRWEIFLGITLAMHHKMDVSMAQFFDYFNECSLRIFSCWNVQMILNVSCKSGHVRLNCLRTFKICWPSATQLSISESENCWLIGQYRWLLCQFQLQLQISKFKFKWGNISISWYAGGRGNTTQTS